jgi:hypothetical protein
MPYVLLICQISLAVILFVAAISKLLSSQELIKAVSASSVPESLVLPIAVIVIILEVILSLNLIFSFSWSLPFAFGGTIFLLGIFTLRLIFIRRRNLSVICGCFGNIRSLVNIKSIIRNIVFLCIGITGFALSFFTSSPLPSVSVWIYLIGIALLGYPLWYLLHKQKSVLQKKRDILL